MIYKTDKFRAERVKEGRKKTIVIWQPGPTDEMSGYAYEIPESHLEDLVALLDQVKKDA